jgi:hypothetical protein
MKTLLSVSALALVAIAATTFVSTASRAEIEYPWCSISSTGQSGTPTCRYATIEQCNAFLAGQAGFCQPNRQRAGDEARREVVSPAQLAAHRRVGASAAVRFRFT